jgi:pimeloyl-ACP methyl ester carboxylesterase
MAEKRGPRLLGPHASNALIESVIANMASVDPQGYRQAARMLSTGDLLADIEQLSPAVPVQFIYGSADVITPPEANQRAASARPSAPVKVLEGAGHACYIEQPDRFLRALEGLIARHD